ALVARHDIGGGRSLGDVEITVAQEAPVARAGIHVREDGEVDAVERDGALLKGAHDLVVATGKRERNLLRHIALYERGRALLADGIARHSRSGVAGISKWRMPSGASASFTAFMIAGNAPTVPASPAPLTPSGFILVGTSWLPTASDGKSSARGIM